MGSVDIPPFLREQQKSKVSSGDIPPFLKKKDEITPSNDGGEVLPTGTESTPPLPSLSPSEVAEGIFSFGKLRKKEFAIPANIPKAEEEVQQVLRKVNVGAVQATDLSDLYKTDYGKPVVKQIIQQYAPSGLGFDEEVFRSGDKWEKLSKDIRTKNRTNAVVAEEQNINEIDNYISLVTQQDKLVRVFDSGKFGEIPASTETKLPVVNPSDKLQLSNLYSTIEDSEYLVDADGKRNDNKKQALLSAIIEKQKYLVSKEGIHPDINKIDGIQDAVNRVNRDRQQGEGLNVDDMIKNDEVNAEHFKLGLSFIKDLKPAMYENIARSIHDRGAIAKNDFSDLSKIGQDINNTQKFIGAANNPALIDTETSLDYSTDESRKSEYAAIIGERAKAAGIKTREFTEDQIFKLGYDLPNKVTLKQLADEEKILGYDAIPKTGAIEAIVQGVMQPFSGLESTIRAFGESPAETYLRSRRSDVGVGGQKVANEKGEMSNILPSDRGNIWYDALRGFGQFIPQVLLTKGVGGVANKALGTTGAVAEGITNYGGTAISTYFQTYGDAYSDALQKTGDYNTARLMGGISGVSSAAFELILPDVKIADKALSGLRRGLSSDLFDLLKKGGDPALLAKAGRPAVEKFVKEYINISGQEVAEEVGTQLVDYITESVFSPTTAKDRNLSQELWDTAKATAVSMAIPAVLGGGGVAINKDFTKSTFDVAAINFNEYKNTLQQQLDNKNINQQQYNDAVKLLSTHKESIEQSPKQDINGANISGKEQLDYAYEDTKIKVYKEKAKNSDGVAKEMWESKIKQAEDVQREILMPKKGEKVSESVVDENEKFKPKVELTPQDIIQKAANDEVLTGIEGEGVKQGTITPDEAILSLAKQKYGVSDDGTLFPEGGRDISLKTSLDVDEAVTKAFPNQQSVIDAIKKPIQESPAAIVGQSESAAENVVPSTLKGIKQIAKENGIDVIENNKGFEFRSGTRSFQINHRGEPEITIRKGVEKMLRFNDSENKRNSEKGYYTHMPLAVFDLVSKLEGQIDSVQYAKNKTSAYVSLKNGIKIRISNHDPNTKNADIELRYDQNTKEDYDAELAKAVEQSISKQQSSPTDLKDENPFKESKVQEPIFRANTKGKFSQGDGRGTYFTTNKEYADLYNIDIKTGERKGSEVESYYADLKNPLVITTTGPKGEAIRSVYNKAIKEGHDGIIAKDPNSPTANEILVFNDSQVKKIIEPKQQTTEQVVSETTSTEKNGVSGTSDETTISEVIDKPASYNGENGSFYQDGQSLIFKVDGQNKEYELGNIDEVKDLPISDFNISTEQSVVTIDENGSFNVRGEKYTNPFEERDQSPLDAIEYNKDGNIVNVRMKTEDGKRRTFRGNIAEDLAYQIHLKEITKDNETRESFEQFINEDAAAKKEIDDARVSETAPPNTVVNNEKVPREKVTPNKKTITNDKKESTKSAQPDTQGVAEKIEPTEEPETGQDTQTETAETVQPAEDEVGNKGKVKGEKATIEEKINTIGQNEEDVLLDSVIHRRNEGRKISVEDTAKRDKLKLELVQNDSNSFIQEMKQEYGKSYLKKILDTVLSVNKNRVDLDKILAVGVALENEINNIREGFVDNDFNISRNELNKLYAKIQKRNIENARISSKALNTIKTLYNTSDNSVAKESLLTDEQSTQKEAILETLLNDEKLSEAADAHETGVSLTQEASQEIDKKVTRKGKVVTEKNKVKAKITDILTDLKDKLNKLDC